MKIDRKVYELNSSRMKCAYFRCNEYKKFQNRDEFASIKPSRCKSCETMYDNTLGNIVFSLGLLNMSNKEFCKRIGISEYKYSRIFIQKNEILTKNIFNRSCVVLGWRPQDIESCNLNGSKKEQAEALNLLTRAYLECDLMSTIIKRNISKTTMSFKKRDLEIYTRLLTYCPINTELLREFTVRHNTNIHELLKEESSLNKEDVLD